MLDLKSLSEHLAQMFIGRTDMVFSLTFVDKPVHVLITILVCLIDFEVQQLAVVNSEAAVKTSHSHHFVNHV